MRPGSVAEHTPLCSFSFDEGGNSYEDQAAYECLGSSFEICPAAHLDDPRSDVPTLGLAVLWYVLQGPKIGETQLIGTVGQDSLHPVPCEFSVLLSDFRHALREGTPAFQRYLGEMIAQVAAATPFEELRSLVAQEQEPKVLEALARATVLRAYVLERIGDVVELKPLLDRLASEANPILRAVVIRSLGETLEPVSGLYVNLIQDSVPEVREAVVANILTAEKMSYGYNKDFAQRAIAAAFAAKSIDPRASAKILEGVDIRTANPESVNQVMSLLLAEDVALRKGAAVALGTVGTTEAQRVLQTLAVRYREESERSVRKTLLQAIVRIGFADAVPLLLSLRSIDSVLEAELDSWLAALQLHRQEWESVLREKEKLAKARGI